MTALRERTCAGLHMSLVPPANWLKCALAMQIVISCWRTHSVDSFERPSVVNDDGCAWAVMVLEIDGRLLALRHSRLLAITVHHELMYIWVVYAHSAEAHDSNVPADVRCRPIDR